MESDISLDYYDWILIAVAASLGGGALVGIFTSVSFRVGLLFGAVVGTLFVYDAIFRNPPSPVPSSQMTAIVVGWHLFLAVLLFSICP